MMYILYSFATERPHTKEELAKEEKRCYRGCTSVKYEAIT